jgi:hypothetical protein
MVADGNGSAAEAVRLHTTPQLVDGGRRVDNGNAAAAHFSPREKLENIAHGVVLPAIPTPGQES